MQPKNQTLGAGAKDTPDATKTPRKFFKTTYTVEVLSEDTPASGIELRQLDYNITDGDCVGTCKDDGGVALTEKEMAAALYEAGSTPDFFQIENGENNPDAVNEPEKSKKGIDWASLRGARDELSGMANDDDRLTSEIKIIKKAIALIKSVQADAIEQKRATPEKVYGDSHVIYSPNESALSDDGAGFWSNKDGWTVIECATVFTGDEKKSLNLPMSTGQDAGWMLEAKAHHLVENLNAAEENISRPAER